MSLTRDQRQKLTELLMSLPTVSDPATRRLLLMDLPRALRDSIEFSGAPATHIRNIVAAVTDDAWDPLPDGSRPVLLVIEDAAALVEGSKLARDLRAFHDQIQAGAAPTGVASTGSAAGHASPTAGNQAATGGVANSGQMGNVQTGSGTQTNLRDVQSGRDVYLGSTINNYYGGAPLAGTSPTASPPAAPRGEIKLDGAGRRMLHRALLAAYPSSADLAAFVDFNLNENLAAIAGGDNLATTIFNLIVWADSRGRLGELISAAAADRPANADLQTLAAGVGSGS